MRGKKRFLIVVLALVIFTSCGRVNPQKSTDLVKSLPILIEMTVDINGSNDPKIIIRAKEIEINREKKELAILGQALITNVSSTDGMQEASFAIRIENARFSLPLGGKITIIKDGKTEVLEQY